MGKTATRKTSINKPLIICPCCNGEIKNAKTSVRMKFGIKRWDKPSVDWERDNMLACSEECADVLSEETQAMVRYERYINE